MATLSLDGPGQGEGGYALAIRPDYEVAAGAALDALAGRDDLDLGRVGALGVSLGGYYAPRAAAFEPRIRAVAGISGPYNMGALWEQLPELTRETFTAKSGAGSDEEGRERALAARPRRRARAPRRARAVRHRPPGPADPVGVDRAGRATRRRRATFVCFEDGNHVCANIPYKCAPAGRGLAARAARVSIREAMLEATGKSALGAMGGGRP